MIEFAYAGAFIAIGCAAAGIGYLVTKWQRT